MTDFLPGYDRIQIVGDDDAFCRAEFQGRVNCIRQPFALPLNVDFNTVAREVYMLHTQGRAQEQHNAEIWRKVAQIATFSNRAGRAASRMIADKNIADRMGVEFFLRVIGPGYYDATVHRPHMDLGHVLDDMGRFMVGYMKPVFIAKNEECVFAGTVVEKDAKEETHLFTPVDGFGLHQVPEGDRIRIASRKNLNDVAGCIHCPAEVRPGDGLKMVGIGFPGDWDPA